MFYIVIDPSNPNVIKVNGEVYIRAIKSPCGSFDIYDMDKHASEWVIKSASDIFEDINGRKPRSKSEITSFTVKNLRGSGFKRVKNAKGRGYIVPPLK